MFINQPAKLSQVVTHIALGVAVLFGSSAAPAIGSSPPTYSLIAQASKSPEDLLRTIKSDRESSQQKIKALDRLIQKYPNFADAYIYRGQIYKEIKDYQKAIQNFDRAIALGQEQKFMKGEQLLTLRLAINSKQLTTIKKSIPLNHIPKSSASNPI